MSRSWIDGAPRRAANSPTRRGGADAGGRRRSRRCGSSGCSTRGGAPEQSQPGVVRQGGDYRARSGCWWTRTRGGGSISGTAPRGERGRPVQCWRTGLRKGGEDETEVQLPLDVATGKERGGAGCRGAGTWAWRLRRITGRCICRSLRTRGLQCTRASRKAGGGDGCSAATGRRRRTSSASRLRPGGKRLLLTVLLGSAGSKDVGFIGWTWLPSR
jgi:hypothetical protein